MQGPYPFSDLVAGEYRGILAVNVPKVASNIHLDGVERLVASGPDGTTRVMAGDIRALRGQHVAAIADLHGAQGLRAPRGAPVGPLPGGAYTMGWQHWDDDGPRLAGVVDSGPGPAKQPE